MVKPPLLKKGDRVAIVAPARKVNTVQIQDALEIIRHHGLEVVLSQHLFSGFHSYLAGSDHERLSDLQSCLDDPTVKAIICARGGYGSTRIVDELDLTKFALKPKWLVGFSDVTAIHLKLIKSEIMSIHGTMPILFSRPDSGDSITSLMTVLLEGNFSLAARASNFNRPGMAQGKLVGGNLSLVADSLGTSTEIETENCILLLEEIDEYFYRIDRMMTQLKRAGKLKNLKGLAIGHMTEIKESELPYGECIEKIILDKVKEYNYPVAFGIPSGHENPNLAWIHGSSTSFSVSAGGVLLSHRDEIVI